METKPTTEAAIINNSSIVLEHEGAKVKQIGLYLHTIARNGNSITIEGFKTGNAITKGNEREKVTVNTSYRTIKYLNTKSAKVGNKSQHPFSAKAWAEFNEKPITGEPIKPAYEFFVNILAEAQTGAGYALTFKRLVPLTEKVFLSYLKGEQAKEPKEIPFSLGYTKLETKNGALTVNFGLLNGNSGISVTNANGVKLNISAKHLPNSISGMCAALSKIVKSEAVQTAPTVEKAAAALEMLKGGISF